MLTSKPLPNTVAGAALRRDGDAAPAADGGQSLRLVFLWLLGGDFAFTFFEQIFGRFIPIFAADLHASNTLIGLMTGSIAGLANLFVLPVVSVRSDRHRGRLGRRIPFLLWATPCAVGSLVLVGFAPEIGRGLHALAGERATFTETNLTLGLLCAFVVSYHLWNMVLVNAYNWLIRDVVPSDVRGRFLSWFRVVGTTASFIFLWVIFPQLSAHRREVFVGIGVCYTAAFLLMCWKVKEPVHAPPPAAQPGVFRMYGSYFRECLALPLYRHYFFAYVLMVAAVASAGPFTTLFARQTIGLSMDDLGKVTACSTLVGALSLVPMGWACDRFKPIRVALVGIAGGGAAAVLALLFVHDRGAWWVYALLSAVPACAWSLGSSTLTMELFPAERFGQFAGGLNVFGYGGLVAGNYLMGVFMDRTGSRYELAFAWSAVLTILALVPMWRVLREWHHHGGPQHYVPPLPPGMAAGYVERS